MSNTINIGGTDVPYAAIITFVIVIVSSVVLLGFSSGPSKTKAAASETPSSAPKKSTDKNAAATTVGIRSTSKYITSVTTMSEWNETLNGNKEDVVVFFAAGWSKPCQKILPFFEELAERYDATFVTIDVDELCDLAKKNKVDMMPTFILFKGPRGDAMTRVSGANKGEVEEALHKFCSLRAL